MWAGQSSGPLPQPPTASLRTRPLSAGARRSQTASDSPPTIRGMLIISVALSCVLAWIVHGYLLGQSQLLQDLRYSYLTKFQCLQLLNL